MKKIVIGSLALLVSGTALADGSPWLGTPGNTTISISHLSQTADQLFVADKESDLPDDLEQTTQWLSVSHVLSDNLAVDAKIGFAESDFLDTDGDSGIADSTLGVTWRLRDEFLADSWLPSVAVRGAINIAGNYDEGELVSVGDGASGAELSIIAGKSINSVVAVSGEVGFRYRDSGVDDDIFVNINTYFQLTDSFSASVGVHIVDAQGDVDIAGSKFTGDFTEVAEETVLADISLTYQFGNKLNVTLTQAEILDGENTAKSTISAITVGYTF